MTHHVRNWFTTVNDKEKGNRNHYKWGFLEQKYVIIKKK